MKEIYRTAGVYRIKNKINNKSYIGKTMMNFGDRWDHHRSLLRHNNHHNKDLQKDWNKFGAENFEFSVIRICDSEDEANHFEELFVSAEKDAGLAYNVSPGGTKPYNYGKHLSEDVKRKIGEKNRINMTGKKASEETRKKMSESQKARAASESEEERRQRVKAASNARRGLKMSDDTKERLRKINQENPPSAKLTPEDIINIRKERSEGASAKELAEKYNTSPAYIGSIVNYRRWKHIA